jgi:serine/threonine protein kinase
MMMMMNRAKLQQETALVRGQYVTSSDTLTSTLQVPLTAAYKQRTRQRTAYKATYSVLYAYSTLYAAKINVLSIPGFKYAVLELGQSLATGLNSMGPAPLENIKSVIWYLLHAVSGLHYYDADFMVIHRDLKPDNILLVPHAHAKHLKVKLMDFNAIAAVHRSQSGSSISGSSSSGGGKDRSSQELPPNLQCGGTASLPLFTMIGSELYMAPEVSARFDAYGAGGAAAAATLPGYDEKVDVYALGVIAMVMVAGGEGRLQELMVPPAGVGRKQHMAGLVSRFAAGQLLVGNMTAENMHMYDGLRQFVGVCCTHDPAQRPSIADLKRKQVPPVSAWLHKLE